MLGIEMDFLCAYVVGNVNKEDLTDELIDSVCLLCGKAKVVTVKSQVFSVQGE